MNTNKHELLDVMNKLKLLVLISVNSWFQKVFKFPASSVFFLCCLLLMQGCATAPVPSDARQKDIKPLQATAVSTLRFQDIPAPVGFKLVPKESFVFENSLVRFALLRYTGRADAARVVRFYKDEMPGYGWNPINIIEHDTRFLNFDNNDQTCVVTIDSSVTSTSVNIAVAPKSSTKKGP